MAYCYTKDTEKPIGAAEQALRDALKRRGFGVLTQIDVQQVMKEKLGVARGPYRILGACNPDFAHTALGLEEDLGVLLPCNVVVRATGGRTFISAVLPTVQLGKVGNPALAPIAAEVERLLTAAVDEAAGQIQD